MSNDKIRFRPYLKHEPVIVMELIKERTGLSLGEVLMSLLLESDTFLKLSKHEKITDLEFNDICNDVFINKNKITYSEVGDSVNIEAAEKNMHTGTITIDIEDTRVIAESVNMVHSITKINMQELEAIANDINTCLSCNIDFFIGANKKKEKNE